ncbi:hypothetical protein CspHIS471_0408070 [Cutaneotrichosporon sp. HIS471]|nr:hypothetical protein CspHIS471_0408070 [Cutaneotrichosporon sp. HIS471]
MHLCLRVALDNRARVSLGKSSNKDSKDSKDSRDSNNQDNNSQDSSNRNSSNRNSSNRNSSNRNSSNLVKSSSFPDSNNSQDSSQGKSSNPHISLSPSLSTPAIAAIILGVSLALAGAIIGVLLYGNRSLRRRSAWLSSVNLNTAPTAGPWIPPPPLGGRFQLTSPPRPRPQVRKTSRKAPPRFSGIEMGLQEKSL